MCINSEFFPWFFPSNRKGFQCQSLCYCVQLLFGIDNICGNIIQDPKSDIKAYVWVEAMAKEEDKVLGIEKFDGTNFGYWRLSPWEEVASPFLEKKHKTMKD